jgi:hypothetical protein
MNTHLQLLSDRPVREYEAFLLELMNGAEDFNIRGLAVVALLEKPLEDGGDAMTAYYNMSLRDRHYSAALIQTDVTYKVAKDAARDLLGLEDPEDQEE